VTVSLHPDVPAQVSRPGDLHPLEAQLLDQIQALRPRPGYAPLGAVPMEEIFEAQARSRIVDHVARVLRGMGRGFYTIGSAGHESNAAVAMALRPNDPALLHYRSGGFYVARAGQAPTGVNGKSPVIDPVEDILSGMLALSSEAMAGGRHKVFGRAELSVIPQTSTIASHLPRAVGLALSIAAAADRRVELEWPNDSVVLCSFGDASLNHSTAQGALNWAAYEAHRGAFVPVVFVCEDNGLGISVESPTAWVGRTITSRPLAHLTVDGRDTAAVFEATQTLANLARYEGQPGILHLRTVRFLGHAGSDVEAAYRTPQELQADVARDPIVGTAQALVDTRACAPTDLVEWYLDERERIGEFALNLCDRPELETAAEVMAPIAQLRPGPVAAQVERIGPLSRSTAQPGASGEPLTLAQSLNTALGDILDAVPEALIFGEDVARKGGVYGVTRGLEKKFGSAQVFDTLLDEQSILGLALGAGVAGHLPIPEIQFLAYLHNAEDQLRGEAATLQFFSRGQYRNPMVVRIAAYAYQKGFGGHFHNDNSAAVLRDIPGVVVASPSHPTDAAAMLRTCAAAARVDGSVCVFLEPIALYHTTDLHTEGDEQWVQPLPPAGSSIGTGRTHGDGEDLTIITWANGLYLSLRAQRRLAAEGVNARILDLRWLAPLPIADMMREAEATGRVLVVDETRHSGGVGEAVVSELVGNGFTGRVDRVAAHDSFVPLGNAANLVLVSENDILRAALC